MAYKKNARENVFQSADTSKLQSTVPLYAVIDNKPLAAEKSKELDPNYSAISVATMNTENIYTEAAATRTLQKSNKIKGVQTGKKLMYLLAISLSVVTLMLIFGCLVALFAELANLKSTASLQQASSDSNIMFQINQSLADLESRLDSQTQMAFGFITELEQKLNTSIDMISQQLSRDYSSLTQQLTLSTSCAALSPSSPSGYYSIRAPNGSAVRVYCDMTRSCGGVTGGWMRVAELDMTDSSHQCPSNLRERTDSSKRTCVINSTDEAACSTTFFSSALEYSKVCGKIIGYQIAATDGFYRNPLIEQNYVDGVTLTHGNPRGHIWTFAAALSEVHMGSIRNCPCTSNQPNGGTPPPAFVGQDYFCDTVNRDIILQNEFFGDDPLWDGAGCGPQSTCCSFNAPPWFYKQLPQPTTDDIEMRVCRDYLANNEDIAIESVEIYVQ